MTKKMATPSTEPPLRGDRIHSLADPFPDIITKSFQECREKRRSLKKKSSLTISPTRPHPSTRIPAQGHEIHNPGILLPDHHTCTITLSSPCPREKRRFKRNNAFSPYTINFYGNAQAKDTPSRGSQNQQPRQSPP